MKTGLTVGKFAPLHKGHELLIETALKEMDQLLLIIYDAPEIPEFTFEMRSRWLKALYPEVVIIIGDRVPKENGYAEAVQKKHEDYILSLVKNYKIDAFYSSETYGVRMSKALGCKHRLIDLHRKQVPVSGKMIRSDIRSLKSFVDPLVYKDLELIYY